MKHQDSVKKPYPAQVYVWGRRHPYVHLNFLGLFNFTAPYLPWVLLAFSVTLRSNAVVDLLGIVAGVSHPSLRQGCLPGVPSLMLSAAGRCHSQAWTSLLQRHAADPPMEDTSLDVACALQARVAYRHPETACEASCNVAHRGSAITHSMSRMARG